jgi:UDP-N-acetylglucosamine pyrophosphorylase
MLQLAGKTGYNTDVELIKSVINVAKKNSDPLLDEQLTLLMQKYEKEIQTEIAESMKTLDPNSIK